MDNFEYLQISDHEIPYIEPITTNESMVDVAIPRGTYIITTPNGPETRSLSEMWDVANGTEMTVAMQNDPSLTVAEYISNTLNRHDQPTSEWNFNAENVQGYIGRGEDIEEISLSVSTAYIVPMNNFNGTFRISEDDND